MTHTRLAEIDDGPQLRVRQDGRRVAQVRGDGRHAVVGGQQRPGVRQHHRVEVDIGDSGGGQDRSRGLMDRRSRRKPRTQVDELADPLPGGPGDGLGHERPVLPDQIPQRLVDRQQPLGLGPVGGVVVLAAERVVVGLCQVRDRRVKPTNTLTSRRDKYRIQGI